MAPSSCPRSLRLATAVCGLALLLVTHVSVRYLVMTLFGFVTYAGLAPGAPSLVLGGYVLVLAGAAVRAVVRRGGGAGFTLGAGLLVLAVEPLASAFTWGDGCQVSAGAAGGLLPDIVVARSATVVRLHPWNGACSVSFTTPVVALGIAAVGAGLLLGRFPDAAASRWMGLLKTLFG